MSLSIITRLIGYVNYIALGCLPMWWLTRVISEAHLETTSLTGIGITTSLVIALVELIIVLRCEWRCSSSLSLVNCAQILQIIMTMLCAISEVGVYYIKIR
jgi:hypothetical protein